MLPPRLRGTTRPAGKTVLQRAGMPTVLADMRAATEAADVRVKVDRAITALQ